MDDYFETFGGVRDYLGGHRRRGPAHRLHRDHPGPAPLPARPDQRQPAAPRDGRADGAQRADPGLGGRPDQGRDARRRAGDRRGRAARHGCCSRSTTSSCSRWRRGSATRSRRWSASRWAAPPTSTVPARRLRRHRPQLARRRALDARRYGRERGRLGRLRLGRRRRLQDQQRDATSSAVEQERVRGDHDGEQAAQRSRWRARQPPRPRAPPRRRRPSAGPGGRARE